MLISREHYLSNKEGSVSGRYVTIDDLSIFLNKVSRIVGIAVAGTSVQQRPIYCLTVGKGKTTILIWSQMHGNESTCTKSLLDLVNYLLGSDTMARRITAACSLKIIPILNPDGATVYTRENANLIDLNRDAAERSQPESRVLRQIYDKLQPDYCFNMHDQRSIFAAGSSGKPATVSFLAPAHDLERSVSPTRERSMQLILGMHQALQALIPGQTGRYDDAYNPNCVGDTFQALQTPTILFEAGHSGRDYQREQTREYIFHALQHALELITIPRVDAPDTDSYFAIPENQKLFFDILIRNADQINPKYKKGTDIGILYKEVLRDSQIVFEPIIEASGLLEGNFGHTCYDCLEEKDKHNLAKDKELSSLLV